MLLRTFLGVVAALSAGASSANAVENLPPDSHTPSKDPWVNDRDSLDAVLASTEGVLRAYFPNRNFAPIVVFQSNHPTTKYNRDSSGKYRVGLHARERHWSDYVYEYSHEFCHILAGISPEHAEEDQSNQWFEEAWCEAASLFTMRRLAVTWATSTNAEWKDYAKTHGDHASAYISTYKQRDPRPDNLAKWYQDNKDALRRDPSEERGKQSVVALVLLEMLEKEPEHWEALATLDSVPSKTAYNFSQYLHNWHARSPAKHRPFIGNIATRFGFTISVPTTQKPGVSP